MGMNFYGEVSELIDYCTFAQWTQRTLTIVILFYLRYKSSGNQLYDENIVRMPFPIPVVFFLTCSSLILSTLIKSFEKAAITVLVFFCTIIVYYLFFWKRLLDDYSGLKVLDRESPFHFDFNTELYGVLNV
jgi:glucan phosphoethanolaminetransferase (alkaline phosphatase superfamily)